MGLKSLVRLTLASGLHYSGKIKALQENSDPPWTILMYHRIINPEDVPYPLQPGMYVRPATFEKHLAYLANHCQVVSLAELTSGLVAGKTFPARTVVLTADDGWLDNYLHAFPLLKRYQLPATIFLATRFIGTDQFFWSDLLAAALGNLWQAREVASADLEELVEKGSFPVPLAAVVGAVLAQDNWEELLKTVDFFTEKLKSVSLEDRARTIDIITQLARKYAVLKTERLFLNWEEIREMAESNITFGSHSHSHRYLPELTAGAIEQEVRDSMECLRSHGITPSSVFCYPGGEHSVETQEKLRNLAVQFALGSGPLTELQSHPMLLGRRSIHEDISSTIPLFTYRVWGRRAR